MDFLAVTRQAVSEDTEVLTSYVALPGLGMLPVNAFVIHGTQPVLVDTSVIALKEAFLPALRAAIDPRELRWLWLTHVDPDHIGSLMEVLAEAPDARLVTTYLGMGKLSLYGHALAERAYLVNPGQELNVGDRTLAAFRPPTFDAPESTGFQDTRTGALFCVDSFGALMTAPAERAADIPPTELQEGLVRWTTADSPWLQFVDRERFGGTLDAVRRTDPSIILSTHLPPAVGMTETLLEHLRTVPDAVRRMDPSIILSTHLPPAVGMTETLLAHLRTAPDAAPFVGPDQAAMERIMAAAAGR